MVRSESGERFARSLPTIRILGTMVFDPIWAEQEHPASGCELLHVIRGTVTLHLKGRRYRAGAGDTLLIPPGARHRDEFDLAEGLEVLFCSFDWPPWRAYFKRISNEAVLRISGSGRSELLMLFDWLRWDRAGTKPADVLVARARLLTILLLFLRETGRGKTPRKEPASLGAVRRRELVRRAKAYLERHYHRCVALDEIAAALDVSSYHLSHVFSAESDFSLFSYLTNLRIEKARGLLSEGRLNVSEVARAVGYSDANYFAKVFRRQTGQSPRQFAASRAR